jgi:transposase
MADSGYDTKEVRDRLTSLKFTPLIPFNKRNTKDTKKINKMSKKDHNLYKKRIKIEHVFGTLKNNKKILTRYEKLSEIFLNFILIHFIKVLHAM